jgi:hypothetical protein
MKLPKILPWALAFWLVMMVGVAQATLSIGTNFTGQTMLDLPALNSGYSIIPPDTDGAVGPNHIVELINGVYAVYDKSGSLLTSTSLDTFWSNSGITLSGSFPATTDPRVVYDPGTSRWYASSLDTGSGLNNFLLAVSNNSNPTQG